MTKTWKGSCHCRRVTFEADIDLAAGTTKCNCTSCWKRRWWAASVKPDAFRLLQGEAELTRVPTAAGGFTAFCKQCGVGLYAAGPAAEWNDGEYVSVNLSSLDDLEPAELIGAPVHFLDGRSDSWGAPEETRHL